MLKFAKFKNKPKGVFWKRIHLCQLKIFQYNTIVSFLTLRNKILDFFFAKWQN